MSQFCSACIIFLEQYTIGYPFSLYSWVRQAPIARSKASVSSIISFLVSNIRSTGAATQASLSLSKACCCLAPYVKGRSFFVNSVRGTASLEQSLINFRLQLASPRNDCTSLTFLSVSYSLIDLVFSGSIVIPCVLIINPRNLTSFLKNSYLCSIVLNPTVLSLRRTSQTSLVCCCLEPFMKIRMLSTQAITVMSRRSRRMSFIILQNVAGTFVSPISITRNSYRLYRVRTTVFYSSPSFIRMQQKLSLMSIFEY